MAELLVSVRSVAEAAAALEGGAAVIDVKEPAHGPLGRASDATIAAVVDFVAGRRPVSAALGELGEGAWSAVRGLTYAKWGLAGWGADRSWARRLVSATDRLQDSSGGCRIVAVAYADWKAARSPEPEAVIDFVCERRWETLLIDTWLKGGKTLLEWLDPTAIADFCRVCRATGVRVALAGSLGAQDIVQLLPAAPDWIAVRTAACRGGDRGGDVCAEQVRRLVKAVAGEQHRNSASHFALTGRGHDT